MAGKSDKKQAATNLGVLKNLYTYGSPIVVLAAVRGLYYSQESVLKYIVLHVPLFLCMYILEKSGRPKYDKRGRITKVGIELNQSGSVTGAMMDIVYTSLFCDAIKAIFNTNALWWLLVVWPFYWLYKLYILKQSFNKSLSRK